MTPSTERLRQHIAAMETTLEQRRIQAMRVIAQWEGVPAAAHWTVDNVGGADEQAAVLNAQTALLNAVTLLARLEAGIV